MTEKKVSRKDFALDREKLEKGVPLEARLPNGGRATIYVLSRWSDAVRRAVDETERKLKSMIRADGEISWEEEDEANRKLVAAMIGGWTLAEECTEEEKIAFLEDAPYLQDRIDRKAAETAAFFTSASKPSSSGPGKK